MLLMSAFNKLNLDFHKSDSDLEFSTN